MEDLIIRRIQNGSLKEFKYLFDKYSPQLFRFLCKFSKDHDLVEDWVQMSFIKAYKNISRFENKSKFSTWLFSIAINEMKNEFRKTKKYTNVEYDEFENNITLDETEEFVWETDMKWLLEELEETKKAVFILFEVEGYSHSEIAEMLSISENNSRTILSRVKVYLKNRWQTEMIK